ncbi:MAG: nucleotidyltransferase family protein [Gammaproteobacteria bacterium]|nr:nucleotidyltransferase family protein [Gammaproteobacteria bacterium]
MMANRQYGNHGTEILLTALREPGRMTGFGLDEWDLLLRIARRTRLLGRLAAIMDETGEMEQLPASVRDHFMAARVFVSQYQRTARWEINRILAALEGRDVPLVLLKGSAYILAGLPPSRGRLLSDVDLLVPRELLDSFEQTLLDHGWESVKLEEYDQRYYRTWMHELPPLRYPGRFIEVDIHHTISPLTSRLSPDPEKLLADSIPLADSRLRVLQPVDMVLHSAVHLFHDGEFINGLRDLVDLTDLFQHFDKQAGFWEELVSRARLQGLLRPLFYTMRYTNRFLAADIPDAAMVATGDGAPPGPVLYLMDNLVEAVMLPEHPDFPRRRRAVAQWLLYVRSHWLRMPPGMLLQHLARKKIMSWRHRKTAAGTLAQGNR